MIDDNRTRAIQLLLAHGFLPEEGRGTWQTDKGTTHWSCAGFDVDNPTYLHLMSFATSDDEMLVETFVNLSTADEATLEKVIRTFDAGEQQ